MGKHRRGDTSWFLYSQAARLGIADFGAGNDWC
jgi:hypothetical protein